MKNRNFQHIRKNYKGDRLSENNVRENPFHQFDLWLEAATNTPAIPEPTAMILSTSDKDSRISSRVVLMKSFSEKGFKFYTNYNSRKGRNVKYNRMVSLLFFWPELERQVRVEGMVEKVGREDSNAYFDERPVKSRISAIISPQSEVVPDREFLEQKFAEAEINGDIKCPQFWGGYIVIPDYFEFWQGGTNRLHDRISYRKSGERWVIERLAP